MKREFPPTMKPEDRERLIAAIRLAVESHNDEWKPIDAVQIADRLADRDRFGHYWPDREAAEHALYRIAYMELAFKNDKGRWRGPDDY